MKKINDLKALTLVLLLLFVFSCDKNEDTPKLHDALILYMAPPDNCNDYVIQTSKYNFFKPSELADDFKIDSLEVMVAFDTTENFHPCGFGGAIPVVDITGITKK